MKLILAALAACVTGVAVFAQTDQGATPYGEPPIFATNRLLARSVNFGNALQARALGA
jgi:hypothetical protein